MISFINKYQSVLIIATLVVYAIAVAIWAISFNLIVYRSQRNRRKKWLELD